MIKYEINKKSRLKFHYQKKLKLTIQLNLINYYL
ncbi:hypothetical protein SAMN05444366_3402 [Flavobacterium saccharophilum]|uniref:Uncharacterized protein n=1 Tax=Flavobacterium saccharophilum TaxID=29534 RepID=A0A1M7JKI6_9FLAO|nr:hypothetical protein SAMN05444366_3402 [Flavobacterium saccharophilum]